MKRIATFHKLTKKQQIIKAKSIAEINYRYKILYYKDQIHLIDEVKDFTKNTITDDVYIIDDNEALKILKKK